MEMRTQVEPARPRGLEFKCYSSQPWEVPYAPLRILLQCLQEDLREDPGSRRLRGRRSEVPALRQQEGRATLVRILRHHVEEECLKQTRSFRPAGGCDAV